MADNESPNQEKNDTDEVNDDDMEVRKADWVDVDPNQLNEADRLLLDEGLADMTTLSPREFEAKYNVVVPSGFEYYDRALDSFDIPRFPPAVLANIRARLSERSDDDHAKVLSDLRELQKSEPSSRQAWKDASGRAFDALSVIEEIDLDTDAPSTQQLALLFAVNDLVRRAPVTIDEDANLDS